MSYGRRIPKGGEEKLADHRFAVELGCSLRELREDRGWKVIETAKLAGVSPSMITQWELGNASPSTCMLRKLGRLYNTPAWQLIRDAERTVADGDARA